MTNLYEALDNPKYFSLKFVEFQDLLCRVALQYFEEQEEAGVAVYSTTTTTKELTTKSDLEDKVYEILEMLWAKRAKRQAKPAARPAPQARL